MTNDNGRAARIRAMLVSEQLDAAVLTHPHDVRYATGYHSVLERWTQMEAFGGAIVFADPAKPLVLVIPEANIGLLAVLRGGGSPCDLDEIRTFDMLNFCEVSRYIDPDQLPSALATDAAEFAALIRGKCEPDIVAAIGACLKDYGLTSGSIAFDEHRISAKLQGILPHVYRDALDGMMRARVVKTSDELARYRVVGKMADKVIAHAGSLVQPGADWNDVQAGICDFMVRNDVIPVDEGAVLFGGSYEQDDFIPGLFRTRGKRALRDGDIVILETQGQLDGFWIDINRTAVIGKPSSEYQSLHDDLRDGFLKMVDQLRPGVSTNSLPRIGFDHLVARGVPTPEKLLVVAHGIGLMPLEIPIPFPASGLAGVKQGFTLEEGMLISLDSLFFGARLGPCHMENVYAITSGAPEPMYETPLELIVSQSAKEQLSVFA